MGPRDPATQPALQPKSGYLEEFRQYGPGRSSSWRRSSAASSSASRHTSCWAQTMSTSCASPPASGVKVLPRLPAAPRAGAAVRMAASPPKRPRPAVALAARLGAQQAALADRDLVRCPASSSSGSAPTRSPSLTQSTGTDGSSCPASTDITTSSSSARAAINPWTSSASSARPQEGLRQRHQGARLVGGISARVRSSFMGGASRPALRHQDLGPRRRTDDPSRL